MLKKRYLVLLAGLVLSLVLLINNSFAASYNYGEALQKTIYFYECQQSGKLPEWNRAKQWRGDSCLNDAVTGGWYDAGDHVKFGLPMAYTAAMLGWSMLEYGDAFKAAGQATILENNLKFVLDYLVRCDKGDSIVYQIGAGGKDHSWWGPVEVLEKEMTRPAYTCNASVVTAETAAALAIGAKLFNNSTYLAHAKSLFTLADTVRSDATYTEANGYYTSVSGFWDELLWAAVWLYVATDDETYLAKAESYVSKLGTEGQTSYLPYKWGHSWDDVHAGALLMLAKLTGKKEYHDFVKMHLDFWSVGFDGSKIMTTPGGLPFCNVWGPLRYSTTEAFLAFVYADSINDSVLKNRYMSFAEQQVKYVLGDNPRNSSYIVGFGNNAPLHPHHRTAHGSWCDMKSTPANHRHILYGALVGGPDATDAFTDNVENYQQTEVACDYNAGLIGALAKMYSLYGGTALANFPSKEPVEDEFFVEAALNSTGDTYTEIKALLNNRSGWPARTLKNLSFNYYLDLSEVFAAGYTVDDLTVSLGYQEFPATISKLTKYSGNIYYVKVAFKDSTSIYPGGQSEFAGEVQFRIAAPTATKFWNPANDYSYKGITNTVTKTKYIPVYDGDTLIYGAEPGPLPSESPSSTPSPTVRPTVTPSETPVQPTPSVTPTPSPSESPSPSPSSTPGGDFAVGFTSSDWGGGGQVSISLKNTGKTTVNGWSITFELPQGVKVTNLWCGKYTQSATTVTITNEGFNGAIAPGASVNFGFTYSGGPVSKPSFCTVNGVKCEIN